MEAADAERGDDEDARLVVRAKAGDEKAREEVILRNLPMATATARAVARRYRRRDTEDDEAEGCVSLIEAIDRFDPSRGVPFEAFARRRVRDNSRDRFRSELDRNRKARVSCETDVTSREGRSPFAAIEDKDKTWQAELAWARVWDLMRSLDADDQMMLGLRYGLFSGEPMPWKVVGGIWDEKDSTVAKRCKALCQSIADKVALDDLLGPDDVFEQIREERLEQIRKKNGDSFPISESRPY